MRINYCKEHAIALLIARDADSGCRHGMQALEVDDVRREVEFPLSTMHREHAASSAGTHDTAVPIRPNGSSVESCVRRVITI